MNIEFRIEGTYLQYARYRVCRIGEKQSLGFISIREQHRPSYYFYPNVSVVLNRAELIEIEGFLKSISDPEQPARAMIELESLPPSGRFHGN